MARVKMTNGEASKLLGPAIDKLFGSGDRHFPVHDAFMLKKAVDAVRTGMKVYQETFREICDRHGAKPNEKNQLVYDTPEEATAAAKELDELNSIEVEFDFKKVKAKKDWPQLALAELLSLEPVLDTTDIE